MSEELCDPLRRHQVYLPCHEHWPAESRPEFTYRRINGREQGDLAGVIDRIRDQGYAEAAAEVYRCAAVGLVGWRNQTDPATGEAVPFAVADLDRVCNVAEALLLIEARVMACRLTALEKKDSASPS